MGPGFGTDWDGAIKAFVLLTFVAGFVVAVPAVLLVGWILRHLTVGWQ